MLLQFSDVGSTIATEAEQRDLATSPRRETQNFQGRSKPQMLRSVCRPRKGCNRCTTKNKCVFCSISLCREPERNNLCGWYIVQTHQNNCADKKRKRQQQTYSHSLSQTRATTKFFPGSPMGKKIVMKNLPSLPQLLQI